MRRMRSAAATLILFIGLGPFLAMPADARERRIPEVELRIADRSSALDTWSSSWIYRVEGQCASAVADGIPTYRPMVEVTSRRVRPALVFHKRARPRVRLATYRRVDDHGVPRGDGRDYRPRLEPRIRAGEIDAWVALPRIRVEGRLFVDLVAVWLDRSDCFADAPEEEASWSFGLRRQGD